MTHVYGVPSQLNVTLCPGKRVSYSDGCQVFRRNSDVTEVLGFLLKHQEFFPTVRTLSRVKLQEKYELPNDRTALLRWRCEIC